MDFGYSIQKDNQIDYDKSHREIAEYIRKEESSFNICMSCGSCTAICSAGIFTDFNPRKLYLLISRGDIRSIRKEIDHCMLCGKCQLACPRGINTRNIILQIRTSIKQNKDHVF